MTVGEGLIRFRSFWIFPGLAIATLTVAYRQTPSSRLSDLFWLLPLGLLAWTLIEYGLHRFVFHTQVTKPWLQKLINGTHLDHHHEPRNTEYILVKTGYALAVSALLALFIALVTRNLFSTAGILSGIWAGFLYYESVHYRVHATSANGPFLARQRHAHFYHHYHDSSRRFGVTTPLWDYVFGTL